MMLGILKRKKKEKKKVFTCEEECKKINNCMLQFGESFDIEKIIFACSS
jgi:hypothetical protein